MTQPLKNLNRSLLFVVILFLALGELVEDDGCDNYESDDYEYTNETYDKVHKVVYEIHRLENELFACQ